MASRNVELARSITRLGNEVTSAKTQVHYFERYRGHDGVREWLRDHVEAFADSRIDFSEIRDLGERVVAIGRLRARAGKAGLSWSPRPLGGSSSGRAK